MCVFKKSDKKINEKKLVYNKKAREFAAAFGYIYIDASLYKVLIKKKKNPSLSCYNIQLGFSTQELLRGSVSRRSIRS